LTFSAREFLVVVLSGGFPLFLAYYMCGLGELESTSMV